MVVRIESFLTHLKIKMFLCVRSSLARFVAVKHIFFYLIDATTSPYTPKIIYKYTSAIHHISLAPPHIPFLSIQHRALPGNSCHRKKKCPGKKLEWNVPHTHEKTTQKKDMVISLLAHSRVYIFFFSNTQQYIQIVIYEILWRLKQIHIHAHTNWSI